MNEHVATRGKGRGQWERVKSHALTTFYYCSRCSYPAKFDKADIQNGRFVVTVCLNLGCGHTENVELEGYQP